jgi:SAM-dependent methyltransferase
MQVLDVGCGASFAAMRAAQLGARVTGIDASEALLSVARSRVPGGAFHRGEIEQLPFADACLDLVSGFNSCQYAGNPKRALRQARRASVQIIVMTWARPEGMEAAQLLAALRSRLPPAPPGHPGPLRSRTKRGCALSPSKRDCTQSKSSTPRHRGNTRTCIRLSARSSRPAWLHAPTSSPASVASTKLIRRFFAFRRGDGNTT